MPDEIELESATNLAVTLAWVAGVASTVFSGSPEAEERARAFDDSAAREEALASADGRS